MKLKIKNHLSLGFIPVIVLVLIAIVGGLFLLVKTKAIPVTFQQSNSPTTQSDGFKKLLEQIKSTPKSSPSPSPKQTSIPTLVPTQKTNPITTYDIKVWMLQYIPPNGITSLYPNAEVTDPTSFTQNILLPALNNATKYHAYSDASTKPALNYILTDVKTENNPPPQTSPTYIPPLTPITYDYEELFRKYDLCNYAKQHDIKTVILWTAGSGSYAGGSWESDITGGNGIPTNNGGHNISSCPDKTIVVFSLNYERGLSEAMESYGHHLEAVFGKFRPEYYSWNDKDSCGTDHNPPNSRFEYDRGNTSNFQSDCRNWKPDNTGVKETLDCNTWGCSGNGWLTFWMQSMPGSGNNLYNSNQKIPNWWVYIGNPDSCFNNALSCSGF